MIQKKAQQKVALVTGGTKGLGKAITQKLLAKGVCVVANYRKDQEQAQRFLEQTQKDFPNQLTILQADIGDEEAYRSLFEHIQTKYQRLDYYIANAAATAFKPLSEIKSHHFEKTFAITVKGFLLGCQLSAELMQEGGAIVALSGEDTHHYMPRHGLLAAAKSALETLVRYFAVELASLDIQVNAVCPGFLATESTQIYLGDQYQAEKAKTQNLGPQSMVTSGDEIADVVLYLCSKEARWVRGQIIRADAGLSFVKGASNKA